MLCKMNYRISQSAPVSPLSSPNPSRENSPAPPIQTRQNFLTKHGMKILVGTTGAALGYGLNKLHNYYTAKQNQFRNNIRKTKIH